MELTNNEIIFLLILTMFNLIITLIVFVIAANQSKKKLVKHSQLGEDFYMSEDKEDNKKKKKLKELDPFELDEKESVKRKHKKKGGKK